ncbi:Cyclin-dependent kinase inhibitor 1 [Dichanthelium oligosanthes]|uniref:Cyclin-dependent kinase inhibitor 1 n=1 Tax=Dichanthelium oligosanthes TaxID=888268 RepID=A0A1E5UII3_9POAL|nr:Cyclin-dependent kinase inhibitor 1 [Dichanthelium oligosanthes]
MGKYMRKCRGAAGEEVAGVEVTQVVGVRTRSRSAAAAGGVAKVAPRRKKALPLAPAPANVAAGEPGVGGDGGSCYIKLRSRTLFMAPPQQPSAPRAPVPAEAAGAVLGVALTAGLSRCSSTASSVDVGCQERSLACRSDAAEAGGDHILELSASDSGSGPDREKRETTPSSRAHGEVSDLESDLASQKNGRSLPATTLAPRPITPPADEIEAFFAAAEKAQAERFAAKYNFDVVRGVPLDGGRFDWIPVVSI